MTHRDLADVIYYNGQIYTANETDQICSAIAIAQGRILACGDLSALSRYHDDATHWIDLAGKTVIPGLIDAHQHPFWGAMQIGACHLNYASLTVAQIQRTIQVYIDNAKAVEGITGESDWLVVFGWYRQGVVPHGRELNRDDLDGVSTTRPILVLSTDCHSAVLNSAGLAKLALTDQSCADGNGQIRRDENGRLTGLLEDGVAMRAFDAAADFSASQRAAIIEKMQHALNQQGITTVMDARLDERTFKQLCLLSQAEQLTVRMLGAYELTAKQAPDLSKCEAALAQIRAFSDHYADAAWRPTPGIAIDHVKLFVDGVIEPQLMTAALLAPYAVNVGSVDQPTWQSSTHYGDYYFTAEQLHYIVPAIGRAGFHPHFHTVGDGAIEASLDAIAALREQSDLSTIRPALAHNELVAPHQYRRFAELNVYAVLSYQWAAISDSDQQTERLMLGAQRCAEREPAGKFIDAGAAVVFGSDWPIDPLDTWYALQVGMTRQGRDEQGAPLARLATDRNLTLFEVLRSVTINAAHMLGKAQLIGSLEPGKLADMVILQQPLFALSADEIASVTVVKTIVGGKCVYSAK